jgi:hypothetical protein
MRSRAYDVRATNPLSSASAEEHEAEADVSGRRSRIAAATLPAGRDQEALAVSVYDEPGA